MPTAGCRKPAASCSRTAAAPISLFAHVRNVDYCSGALLATPRVLFERLGGFDARYRPAYYEDTDYCFTVRAHGLQVVCEPASVIVHREGASAGTDLDHGMKRHQRLNRATFVGKWRAALDARDAPPAQYDDQTWFRLATSDCVGA